MAAAASHRESDELRRFMGSGRLFGVQLDDWGVAQPLPVVTNQGLRFGSGLAGDTEGYVSSGGVCRWLGELGAFERNGDAAVWPIGAAGQVGDGNRGRCGEDGARRGHAV